MTGKTLQGKASLSARQKKALTVLLYTPVIEKAAEKLKLNASTIHRWMKDATFAAELARLREELVQGAVDRLKVASNAAVNGLILVAASGSDSAKVAACKVILEH